MRAACFGRLGGWGGYARRLRGAARRSTCAKAPKPETPAPDPVTWTLPPPQLTFVDAGEYARPFEEVSYYELMSRAQAKARGRGTGAARGRGGAARGAAVRGALRFALRSAQCEMRTLHRAPLRRVSRLVGPRLAAQPRPNSANPPNLLNPNCADLGA